MKTGDKVSVIDENFRGKIIAVLPLTYEVEDEFGFTYQFLKSKVVSADQDLYDNIRIIKKQETSKPISKKHNKEAFKIDLHFENLVKNPRDYDSFERLLIQKEKLNEAIEFCRKHKLKRLLIIHGIGDGVLQKMVYDIISGLPYVEYDEDGFFYHQSGNLEVKFR